MSVKTMAYKRPCCLVCGDPLEHRPSGPGRIKRFCGPGCKQKNNREWKKWARLAVDAELVGEPERPMAWRHKKGLIWLQAEH